MTTVSKNGMRKNQCSLISINHQAYRFLHTEKSQFLFFYFDELMPPISLKPISLVKIEFGVCATAYRKNQRKIIAERRSMLKNHLCPLKWPEDVKLLFRRFQLKLINGTNKFLETF